MTEIVRLLSDRSLVCRLCPTNASGMSVHKTDRSVQPNGVPVAVLLFMAVAAAFGTSTIYLLQPAVADVAGSLGVRTAVVGVALLVPLVDRYTPGRVLAAQFGVLAAVLALGAAVGTIWLLGVIVAVAGACSAVGAGMSSIVGRLP